MRKMPSLKKSYTFRYTLIVFMCMFLACVLVVLTVLITNWWGFPFGHFNLITFAILALIFCLVFGTIIAFGVSKNMAERQKEFDRVIEEVASGNFDVQLEVKEGPAMEMTANINKMIKELKNVKVLKSDFVTNFSHELKTPIVSIKGFSEILLNEKLPPKKQKEFLKIIYDESDRLSKLSSNMLYLSNLESSALPPEKENYPLDEQVKSAVQLLSNEAEKKGLSVKAKLEPCTYLGNSDMMLQVWINLISNAVKYSDEGGTIDITLSKTGGLLTFKIRNFGVGIKAEDLPHVFDQFYQTDRSHFSDGNGLGLAIAKQIVRLHGGQITVASTPLTDAQSLTEFTVTLFKS